MKLKTPKPGEGDDGESNGMSWGDRLTILLTEYKWHIGVVCVLIAIYVYHAQIGIPSWGELPREVRIILIGTPVMAFIGYMPAKAVAETYFEIEKVRVNEVDAIRGGEQDPEHLGINRSYDVPRGIWDDKTIVEGAPYLNFDGEWNVERLEWNEGTQELRIWGPWKGEMNSTQLESWYHAVSETQGRQRFWMQVGKSLKFRLPSWLRSMEQSITERTVRMTMNNSTDSLDIYESEVVANAEAMSESVDVPEGYYSKDFASEVEENIDDKVDEATGGAMSALKETGDVPGDAE